MFIEDQAEDFRSQLWPAFCSQHDQLSLAGNLPAQRLIPLLRRFRDGFHKRLIATVQHLATQQIRSNELGLWGSQIREIVEFQQFFEMMSCRVLGHQTAADTDRPWPLLWLRHGIEVSSLKAQLDTPRFPRDVKRSEFLQDLPLVGFLFQELPVKFATGSEGRITVAPYEELDLPEDSEARRDDT